WLPARAGRGSAGFTGTLVGAAGDPAAVGSTVVRGPHRASPGTGLLRAAQIAGHRLTPIRTRPRRTARLRTPARAVGW
ncbi:hypothetical protein MHN80_22290, partial [Gordonia McavH-238-E]|uniref:hypothetical protein n=1 Tax=Gordonia sp. McavH-238-E TaxID=2917736 RepID=UPI001EF511D6